MALEMSRNTDLGIYYCQKPDGFRQEGIIVGLVVESPGRKP